MRKTFLLLLSLGVMAPLGAPAKPYHITSVKWIVDNRNKLTYDDHYVTIVGHVTRRIGDEEYWFTDGTGSIRLDSENFDLPVERRLIIGGRIDEAYLGFGHIEVDVRNWKYAPHHHPTVAPKPVTRAANIPVTAPALTPAPEPRPVLTRPAPVPLETSTPAPAPISTSVPVAATNTAPTLAPPSDTTASPTPPTTPTMTTVPAPTPSTTGVPPTTPSATTTVPPVTTTPSPTPAATAPITPESNPPSVPASTATDTNSAPAMH